MKKKRGRPTKYRREFVEVVYNILAEGKTIAHICRELGINKDTFYSWARRYPEFSDAFKKGRVAGEAVFTDKVMKGAFDTKKHKYNNGLISLIAVNCYGWSSVGKSQAAKDPDYIPLVSLTPFLNHGNY